MSKMLSDDQIAALVEAARQGNLPSSDDKPGRRRRVQAVDFTRPTKFTKEQERRMRHILDSFCQTASTRLSVELRMPIELEALSLSQVTWLNAHEELPRNSTCAVVLVQPLGTRMLLNAEASLVVTVIEALLGGSIEPPPRERELTDIDLALARRLFATILNQLSSVWTSQAGVELELSRIETQIETAHLVAVSEPTLAATIEARVGRVSATLNLLVPHSSIAPVAEALTPGENDNGHGDAEGDREAVGDALRRVEVTVRAEVAAREIEVDEVLSLAPGDVLRLGAPVGGGVTLYAEQVPVYRGMPGRTGSRRAVSVSRPVEGGRR